MNNKTALITGANSGIGAEIAKKLAKKGVLVFINYSRSDNKAEKVANEIKKSGGSVELVKADISNEEDVKEMFNTISKFADRLDYLVNNAGIDIPQPLEKYKLSDWNRILTVNLTGKFLCIKHALPLMKKSDAPRVVNIASRMAEKPYVFEIGAYACAEAGVVMLTKVAAKELAKYNVRVNTVSPGLTRTPLTESIITDESEWRKIAKSNPSKRVGKPEDIANAVLFLLSDEADYVNGTNLEVNGGSVL
ncbi:MAG: SDR family NAD(P)-dependent oxidoreductase [Nanoarchaeota archaeon]